MNAKLNAVADFLKSIGCTDITAEIGTSPNVGKLRVSYKTDRLVIAVQMKPEWGTDTQASTGRNWKDRRYPYSSTLFLLQDGEDDATHYIVLAADLRRLILTPVANVNNAGKAWTRIPDASNSDGYRLVRSATLPNWTPKLAFFIRKSGDAGWVKDDQNIWEKPKSISMDPDEFLASL